MKLVSQGRKVSFTQCSPFAFSSSLVYWRYLVAYNLNKQSFKNNFRLFSTSSNMKKKYLNSKNVLFNKLKDIITDLPCNNETQKKIEEFLLDNQYIERNYGNEDINYDLVNNKFKNILIEASDSLNKIINNFKDNSYDIKLKDKKLTQNKETNYYLSVLLRVVGNNYVISVLFGRLLRIISNPVIESKISTKIFGDVGKDIVRKYNYLLYFEEKNKRLNNNQTKYSMSEWVQENENTINKFNNVLLHNIGANIVNWLKEVELIEYDLVSSLEESKKTISIIKASENIVSALDGKTILNLPLKIPMIVKPNPYYTEIINNKCIERLGGYVLNDEKIHNELFIKNWELKYPSKINKVNTVYSSINSISSVGFKINKDVLKYLKLNGTKYGIIDESYVHPLIKKLNTKAKLYKSEKIELESFLSKKYVQDNIFGLADVFENVHEFFIPVRIDNRGRIYCEPEYLNYQSQELAKSLLLFSRGEKVSKADKTSINYLKLFGANCFGLDKKSFLERVKWVEDNTEKIRNFQDGELISKASSKFLFISFCFEYNKWLDCLDNHEIHEFVTHLPIQLDATCNGYQHLSMLGLDAELAEKLNLTKSTVKDAPKDFYSFLVELVKIYLHQKLVDENYKNEYDCYNRLINLTIQRTLVKKAIMTIPYNASSISIIQYLRESFEYCEKSNISTVDSKNLSIESCKNKMWYKHKEDPSVILESEDFNILSRAITHVLFNKFDKLNKLVYYFKEIAKICYELNLFIPWTLPSGVEIQQSYMDIKDISIKPFGFNNNSFLLKYTNQNKYDKRKQIRSFMPNLIHSLDAASLTLLVDSYFKGSSEFRNIYAIHDCFAVTCNNTVELINLLKFIYIKIYSNIGYLRKLDKEIRHHIINHYGNDCFDEANLIIKTKNKNFNYPDIEKILNNSFDIENNILESQYIIN